jgi:hypothetical protein
MLLCCSDPRQSTEDVTWFSLFTLPKTAYNETPIAGIGNVILETVPCMEQAFNELGQQASVELLKAETCRARLEQAPSEPQTSISKGTTFSVNVIKTPESRFGLTLYTTDMSVCLVREVQQGLLVFTANLSETIKVRPLDSLLSVNGIAGSANQLISMMQEATGATELALRRPQELHVSIRKGDGLGVSLNHIPDSVGLIVSEINQGSVKDWNDANPDFAVKVGMRIVSVNGTSAAPEILFEHLDSSDVLDLKLLSWQLEGPCENQSLCPDRTDSL